MQGLWCRILDAISRLIYAILRSASSLLTGSLSSLLQLAEDKCRNISEETRSAPVTNSLLLDQLK